MSISLFLEGTDGSGKSTQFTLLKKYLDEKGVSYVALREPGGSNYYEALRDFYLQSEFDHPAVSDALLSAAGRAANIQEAKNALKKGWWVISDRAYPSSYVYQEVQGLSLDEIKAINQHALGDFNFDIKILLDVPTEIAQARVENSGAKKDYWESRGYEFFEQIRQKYLKLASEEDFVIIDASGTIEDIHRKIIEVINNG